MTRIAPRISDTFAGQRPEIRVDRDIVLAGALWHDVGKPYEFDPVNRAGWANDPSATGQPTLRHMVLGTYACLSVGRPGEVARIGPRAFARRPASRCFHRVHDRASRRPHVLERRGRARLADLGIAPVKSDFAGQKNRG
jgi:hypothetical protein